MWELQKCELEGNGHTASTAKKRARPVLSILSPFHLVQDSIHEIVWPTSKMGLPISLNITEINPMSMPSRPETLPIRTGCVGTSETGVRRLECGPGFNRPQQHWAEAPAFLRCWIGETWGHLAVKGREG